MAVRTISRALRFNDDDSARLTRTCATPTNNLKWTFSCWLKRSTLGATSVFGSGTAPSFIAIFNATDNFQILIAGLSYFVTSQVFRDTGAWYHLTVVYDSANATQADRIILYVNGQRATTSTASCPLNQTSGFNLNTATNSIGSAYPGYFADARDYFDGYMTEVHFLDGTALDASSFGETDPATGQWLPSVTSFTSTQYGANGFYLTLANNTSTTTLGDDTAPTGTGHTAANNWTTNNFSVTPGIGNDALLDTPNNNFCTLNPLDRNSGMSLSNGNLQVTATTSAWKSMRATFAIPSGKWYWEATPSVFGNAEYTIWGLAGPNESLDNYVGSSGSTAVASVQNNNAGHLGFYGAGRFAATLAATQFALNDILMFAYDADAGRAWMGKNGTWFNSGDPVAGTGMTHTGLPAYMAPAVSVYSSVNTAVYNFGQRSFSYTPPTGFLELSAIYLPAPSITLPSAHFNVKLYTGNAVPTDFTDFGYTPDLVWIKSRSAATDHVLIDSSRTGQYPYLSTNATNGNRWIADPGEIDDLLDSPSNNYVTWNFAARETVFTYYSPTLSNASLRTTGTATNQVYTLGTLPMMSGAKYYFEVTATGVGTAVATYVMVFGGYYGADGTMGGVTPNTAGATYTTGDIIGIGVDAVNNTLEFYKNGVKQGATRALNSTGSIYTIFMSMHSSSGSWTLNGGQRPFQFNVAGVDRPASDYLPLCTGTLPPPAISQPKNYFDILLHTGTAANKNVIGLSFAPDLVWSKNRGASQDHAIFDRVRPRYENMRSYLSSNATNAQRVFLGDYQLDPSIDAPLNNFCTWNPLSTITTGTLSNGNLDTTGTAIGTMQCTIYDTYWEITAHASGVTAGVQNEFGTGGRTIAVPLGKTFGFRISTQGDLHYRNITDGGVWTDSGSNLVVPLYPYVTGGSASGNFGQRPFLGTDYDSAAV